MRELHLKEVEKCAENFFENLSEGKFSGFHLEATSEIMDPKINKNEGKIFNSKIINEGEEAQENFNSFKNT